jgi:hypothetical protein
MRLTPCAFFLVKKGLLINLCKGQSFFVMDGRVGNIRYIGELTYMNARAVDYLIC